MHLCERGLKANELNICERQQQKNSPSFENIFVCIGVTQCWLTLDSWKKQRNNDKIYNKNINFHWAIKILQVFF